ncbi:MAG: 30S ribosomal protein S7 [Candidatus Thermoplasmatota archaeon]
MEEALLFGKYSWKEVEVKDLGLKGDINLTPIILPYLSYGRHANKWFGKVKLNIVERLINNMMRTEHATGEKQRTYKMVRDAFEIIATKTKRNPIQVFIDAIQNAAPCEEVTRLRYGGISVPKAVDCSPSRRVDFALANICKGAISASHDKKKRIEECLADEIVAASKNETTSFAISKKDEVERIAASAR